MPLIRQYEPVVVYVPPMGNFKNTVLVVIRIRKKLTRRSACDFTDITFRQVNKINKPFYGNT